MLSEKIKEMVRSFQQQVYQRAPEECDGELRLYGVGTDGYTANAIIALHISDNKIMLSLIRPSGALEIVDLVEATPDGQ